MKENVMNHPYGILWISSFRFIFPHFNGKQCMLFSLVNPLIFLLHPSVFLNILSPPPIPPPLRKLTVPLIPNWQIFHVLLATPVFFRIQPQINFQM